MTFFQEEGRYAPRKRAWKYGTGSSKAWNCYKPGVGKLAPGCLRTRQFGKDASLSMRVEDLPMMWQMRPMTKEEDLPLFANFYGFLLVNEESVTTLNQAFNFYYQEVVRSFFVLTITSTFIDDMDLSILLFLNTSCFLFSL